MKIREVLNRTPYKFKDLIYGDMFYYEYEEDCGMDGRFDRQSLCVKILPFTTALVPFAESKSEKEYNAFDLSENTLRSIGENNNVQLVDAEIVIKEIKKDYAIGEVEEWQGSYSE